MQPTTTPQLHRSRFPMTGQLLERGGAGVLLRPGETAYAEAAHALHNSMFHDRRPALIARPRTPGEVAGAIKLARSEGLPIAVRGGGHNVAGHSSGHGGIVIDTRLMDEAVVDPVRRTVRAAAGLRWRDLDAATQSYGLAVTGGRVSTTGIVGQGLGSGSGWLERLHGFGVDNVMAVELVTAEGEFVRATEEDEPELFWGLRGAAPNFGVVTAIEFRLHPVGPIVLGGLMMYDGGDDPTALVGALRDAIESAPDELGVAIVFVVAPPEPFVPPELQGKPAVGLMGMYAGEVADGTRAYAPLRALGPVVDFVEPMPYTAVQQVLDPITGEGMRQYWKSDAMTALTDDAVAVLAGRAQEMSSPFTQLILEPKGRAIAQMPEEAMALGGRDAGWAWLATSIWDDPAGDAAGIAWARSTARAMEPHSRPGQSPNFTSDPGADRVRNTYGVRKYERLVALKDRWDPENLFHNNANIRPSAG